MRIIFNDDTLYVDVEGNIGQIELNIIKKRLFSILDQYEVDNIIVNTNNVFNLKENRFNSFVDEYYKRYSGNILIN